MTTLPELAATRRSDAVRARYHEAGHAVAAHDLGLPVPRWILATGASGHNAYVVRRDAAGPLLSRELRPTEHPAQPAKVPHLLAMLMAGGVAECLAGNVDADPFGGSIRQPGSDVERAWPLAIAAGLEPGPAVVDAIELATDSLARNWPTVQRIAARLADSGYLPGSELVDLLRTADPPPPVADATIARAAAEIVAAWRGLLDRERAPLQRVLARLVGSPDGTARNKARPAEPVHRVDASPAGLAVGAALARVGSPPHRNRSTRP